MAMPEIYGLYCEWNFVILLAVPSYCDEVSTSEKRRHLPFHVPSCGNPRTERKPAMSAARGGEGGVNRLG